MTTIAVCIVNYNTRDLLRECLDSALRDHPAEVVVVDNASRDGSGEMVRTEFPATRLVSLDQNLGYGAAANRAVALCQAECVLLLNGDTRLTAGSLESLRRYLAAHEGAALIGPRVVSPDGALQASSFRFPTPVHMFLYLSSLYRVMHHVPSLQGRRVQSPPADSAKVVPWVLGAAMAFRRAAFEAAGGFDESFFMYFEEVDLCYRLARAGWQIHFAPVTDVVHVGGASTRQQRADMAVQYFASLAHFYRKHYSRMRLGELVVLVQCFALIRLAHAGILLRTARDERKRARLHADATAYRRLLRGGWIRPSAPAAAIGNPVMAPSHRVTSSMDSSMHLDRRRRREP